MFFMSFDLILVWTGEGDVLLKASRHPCLEMQDVAIIDNDATMVRGECLLHFLSVWMAMS